MLRYRPPPALGRPERPPLLQNRGCATILPRERRRLFAQDPGAFNRKPVIERAVPECKGQNLTPADRFPSDPTVCVGIEEEHFRMLDISGLLTLSHSSCCEPKIQKPRDHRRARGERRKKQSQERSCKQPLEWLAEHKLLALHKGKTSAKSGDGETGDKGNRNRHLCDAQTLPSDISFVCHAGSKRFQHPPA